MDRHFIIDGTLPGLNEYTKANRSNRYAGANMKAVAEERVYYAIKQQLAGVRINYPVRIRFIWVEPNNRRDLDNIAFAKKFVLDAMVKAGLLPNDNRRYVRGFEDFFETSPGKGSVEVIIREEKK